MVDHRLNTAVIGVGSWGQNLLRNLLADERVNLRWLCDADQAILSKRARSLRSVRTTTCVEEALDDGSVDAVAIATPAELHYACALAALKADKHVFVEKPIALHSEQAARLVAEAGRRHRVLMVGHLMRHHPVVEHLKRLVDSGDLGEIRYLYTQRLNLGVVRTNENAWWSLAPHDISVICFLFDAVPQSVSATGRCFLQEGIEDVVFATLYFADGRMAHVHVSWLDPYKIRRVTLVGTEKMAAFDDMEATEKLRIYDKGARVQQEFANYAEAIQLRTGDIVIPKVDLAEPLARECRRFVDAVLDGQPVFSDGQDGLNVVRVLEAGAESLRGGGAPTSMTARGASMADCTPVAV